MKVADVILVKTQAANDITIHDADVIDVEQELEAGTTDGLDEIDAEIDIVPEVARMALHGVRAVAGVQVLKNEGDALLLRERQHFLPGAQTRFDGLVTVHAVEFHPCEGDDLLAADIRGEIDRIRELGDDFVVKIGIARPFGETVTADEGDFEP